MTTASGPKAQGMLPFAALGDELAALRDEAARLRAENARLLRLLKLTPQQAQQPGPAACFLATSRRGLTLAVRGGAVWRRRCDGAAGGWSCGPRPKSVS